MMHVFRVLAAFLLLAIAGSTHVTASQSALPSRPRIDVESYVLDVTVDPTRNELIGVAEIRFVRLDRTPYATFDLDPRMRVRDVFLIGEAPVPVRFRQFDSDSTLEVDLGDLGPFDDPVLRVEYEGVLDAREDEFDPVLANIGSDNAFFLEEAKWFPLNGVDGDPATMRLNLVIPEDWRVVSNLDVGEPQVVPRPGTASSDISISEGTGTDILNPNIPGLGGRIQPVVPEVVPTAVPPPTVPEPPETDISDASSENDRAVPGGPALETGVEQNEPGLGRPALIRNPAPGDTEVIEDVPLTDLGALRFEVSEELAFDSVQVSLVGDTPSHWGTLALGRYETVVEPLTQEGEVEVFALEGALEAGKAIGAASGEYFGFYRDLFGDSSAETLRVVEIRGANWDARSVPGMLWLAADEFREDVDPWVLSQHVASQWFPLTYGADDPADAWISEGLAVFASMFYFEETLPAEDALEQIERTLVKALSYEGDVTVANALTLPRDSAEYRAVTAYRGGFIFRMLRDVMGDEQFRSMLDQFPETFGEQGFSTARLQEVASKIAGRDLFFFFDQWLNDKGIPEFTREYTIFRRPAGGYEVVGQIYQDLDLFQMPVEVEVQTDGEPEYYETWVSGPFSDLDLTTERKPRIITIDPNLRLLRMSPEMRIKVHISRGEDLAAAGRLNDALEEYQAAIDLDRLSSHALFRMGEALFELGNLGLAANVFRDAINGDLDPTWIEVWSYINLGKIFDARQQRERAITEYQKAINTGDDAYGAQAEAERYVAEPFTPRG